MKLVKKKNNNNTCQRMVTDKSSILNEALYHSSTRLQDHNREKQGKPVKARDRGAGYVVVSSGHDKAITLMNTQQSLLAAQALQRIGPVSILAVRLALFTICWKTKKKSGPPRAIAAVQLEMVIVRPS
jgi:hypothetical protein